MSDKPVTFSHLFEFDEVETTMVVASDKVDEGFENGLVVLADSQRSGRGRNGKSFLTPPNMGIWCTLGVEVKGNNSPHYYIKAFSVALSALLQEAYDVDAKIKWPNDIYIGDKKVCGILTELHRNGKTLLLGFGLNLNQTCAIFGESLKDIATSIYLETKKLVEDKEYLLNDLLLSFETALQLPNESLDDNYKKFSMAWGKQALFNNEPKYIVGVDVDGALLVGDSSKPEKYFAGDLVPLKNKPK